MSVAKVCRLIPSALPHEYLGFHKLSLEGMFVSISLLRKVVEEENEANESAKDSSSNSTVSSRLAKHMKNR